MWTETHQWWSPWLLCYFYASCNDVLLYITVRLSCSQGHSLFFVFHLLVFFWLLFFCTCFLAIVKFWAQNSYTVLLMLKVYVFIILCAAGIMVKFCFPFFPPSSFSVIKRLGRWFFFFFFFCVLSLEKRQIKS